MTIQFNEQTLTYSLYINVSNVVPGSSQTLLVTSQASNTDILNVDFTIDITNDRYTKIDFTIDAEIPSKHLNSIANYTVIIDGNIIDEGILKITTNPGGGTFTQNYISNNEFRESKVYYRPNY